MGQEQMYAPMRPYHGTGVVAGRRWRPREGVLVSSRKGPGPAQPDEEPRYMKPVPYWRGRAVGVAARAATGRERRALAVLDRFDYGDRAALAAFVVRTRVRPGQQHGEPLDALEERGRDLLRGLGREERREVEDYLRREWSRVLS